jgi:hypothetical protein
MKKSESADDAIDYAHELERRRGQTPQAFVGGVMCVVALLVLGAILTHSSSNSSNDLPGAGSPISRLQTRQATAARSRVTTRVKKAPAGTTASTAAPTTASVTTSSTSPAAVVQTGPPATQPRIQSVVTVPPATVATTPATQPPPVAVPFPPPTLHPPDTVAVPFVPTSLPNG